jgi:hypothetical protein
MQKTKMPSGPTKHPDKTFRAATLQTQFCRGKTRKPIRQADNELYDETFSRLCGSDCCDALVCNAHADYDAIY